MSGFTAIQLPSQLATWQKSLVAYNKGFITSTRPHVLLFTAGTTDPLLNECIHVGTE